MEELKQYSQNRLVSGTGNAKLTTLAHSRQTNSLPLEGLFRSVTDNPMSNQAGADAEAAPAVEARLK